MVLGRSTSWYLAFQRSAFYTLCSNIIDIQLTLLYITSAKDYNFDEGIKKGYFPKEVRIQDFTVVTNFFT